MRSLPANMRNPRTEKQVTQRNRFSLIGKFLKSILPVISVGFRHIAGASNSAFGAAMSYNIQNAVKGVYPDFEIDFQNVSIAMGDLYPAYNVAVVCEAGKLNFSWDAALLNNTTTEDRVMVVAYNPAKGQSAYDHNLATRAAGNGKTAGDE